MSILLAIAAMHVALCIPAQQLSEFTTGHRILGSQAVHFDYVHGENYGRAFDFLRSARERAVSAVVTALWAMSLSALFLSLVDRRYTLQLIALTCMVALPFTHAGERLLLGYQLDYFQIHFGRYH